jgi:hypothetical protein
LGAPTTLIKDDEYEGYKFPAGTVFTWNSWAISLSDKEYDEPLKFKPERFMNKDLDNALKGHWAFGPGIPPPRPRTVQKLILQAEEFVLDGMSDNRICLWPRLDFSTVLTLWKTRFLPCLVQVDDD